MNIIDIGGGLGGFQFVLDKIGCSVTNVDPGPAHTQSKWRCDAPTMRRLNRLFGTSINLPNAVLDDAEL